jgi:predicted RNA-binding protein with PIN domain
MPYIIDGNNVMGQTPGWHRDKPAARRGLLLDLAGFAKSQKARVTVVFDGAPSDPFPEGSAFQGVKILYAEKGSDADTRIQKLVESSANARELTVVTSDRHLAFLVHARGAKVIRSGDFRRKMRDARESASTPPEDGEKYETGDVPSWMRYFGALPEDDDIGDESN